MIDATEQIIQQIAEEQDIPADDVRDVVSAQFGFVAKKMKDDSFRTIRLQYLGKFTVDQRKFDEIKKMEAEGRIKTTKSGRPANSNR